MERQLARYGYWFGLVCVAISVLWRIFTVIPSFPHQFRSLSYNSFFNAGAVFLLISIASVNYAWLREKKAEKSPEKPLARAA